MVNGESNGKILVIRGGAIGDFILTLPVFTALREMFPKVELHALGYPKATELAVHFGLADGSRSMESRELAGFFATGADLNKEWMTYFQSFSIVISYLFDPDGIFQKNVLSCGKFQFIQGPHRPEEEGESHAAKVLAQPLQRLAIFDPDLRISLKMDPAPSARVLVMHPGSGSERKNWPEARWGELAAALSRQTDWDFLLVGGEAEGGKLERIAARMEAGRARVLKNRPLSALAREMAGCGAFIGHDSGITHLAAAAGLPGVVLWGESREAVWKPLSDTLRLLKSPRGLSGLTVEEVVSALSKSGIIFRTGN